MLLAQRLFARLPVSPDQTGQSMDENTPSDGIHTLPH
jgi:hypothetical protein